jgi:hypothetical protein
MHKVLWTILLIVLMQDYCAQNQIMPLNNQYGYELENTFDQKSDHNVHSNIRPYLKKDYSKAGLSLAKDSISVPVLPIRLEPLLIHKTIKKSSVNINPIIGAQLIQQTSETRLGYYGGVEVSANFPKKLGFYGWYRFAEEPNFNYLDSSGFIGDGINGVGRSVSTRSPNSGHHYEFYGTYNPNKYFEITAGRGSHFWGDGYRSLILSDNAAAYPFVRINSSFWNVKYTNLYAMHKDDTFGERQNKYSTSHQLSWNILRNLNFSVFESVIWSGQDSLVSRGFDVNYLNPIIFYRPIEYLQGSSDNVLLGASLKYVIEEEHVFYSQFVLDEFLLSEIRAKRGWWANKYSLQIGYKGYNFLGIQNLSVQGEWNMARPFMYAHKTSLLNHGHEDQSLAHPLGANFQEALGRIRYQKDKWYFEAKVIYQDRGADFNSVSNGGNIFRSYTARNREYYHTIGQGEAHYVWHNELRVSYQFSFRSNLKAFVSYANRSDRSVGNVERLNLIRIGINSDLWNTYDDY